MKRAVFLKEIKSILNNKTTLIYFFLLFSIIVYSFYSAVNLYSKASLAAIDNPLYAAGFEPNAGVFKPTMGGFFLILSLIAPFIFIRIINDEKTNNTVLFLFQLPVKFYAIFSAKIFSAIILILFSILSIIPVYIIWVLFGGHIPVNETILLFLGYFLYSLFIIAVSFFSASISNSTAQASIITYFFIMISWFIDFGKEMNIMGIFKNISDFTLTAQLKQFEDGIFSIQSIFYFILLSSLFFILSYCFFSISFKNKYLFSFLIFTIFLILFFLSNTLIYKKDLTESKTNSFSIEKTAFLNNIGTLKINVYLEPTDSRFKDYQNDFLKKLKLVKNNIKLSFIGGDKLKENYGKFEYELYSKTKTTYSNSEEEIFMVLEELSGKKTEKASDKTHFKGYPLVVRDNWAIYPVLFYLFLFIVIIIFMWLSNRRG